MQISVDDNENMFVINKENEVMTRKVGSDADWTSLNILARDICSFSDNVVYIIGMDYFV